MFKRFKSLHLNSVKTVLCLILLLFSFTPLSFANHSAYALTLNCGEVQRATDENSTDGIGDFMIAGGVAPFTYKLFNAVNQEIITGTFAVTNTTVQLNDLKGGTYRIEVMGQNETQSCTFTIGLTNCALGVSVANTTVTCASDLGNLNAVTTNGVAPLTYLWNTGATTANLANIVPGIYTVTVTDNAGCTATDMGTISAMSPTTVVVSISSTTPATDFQTHDGAVNFSINGGTGPFDIVITNIATNAIVIDLNNLNSPISLSTLFAGNYSIRVTDASGCTGTNTFQIGVLNCLFDATVSDITTDCDISNNTLTAVPNNLGVEPFTYLWSNTATTASISNLVPGTYSVVITDAVGCSTASISGMVQGNPPITLACNVTLNNTLIDASSGAATFEIRQGTAPYTITLLLDNSVISGPFNIPAAGISNLNTLATGLYQLNIVDQNNCPISCNFEITEPPCEVMVTIPDVILPCNTERGDLEAVVSGGVPPLTLEWSNDPTVTATSNPNLLAGEYKLTVTDAVNCVKTATATIFNTQPLITGKDTVICTGKLIELSTLLNGTPKNSLEYGTVFGTYGTSDDQRPMTTTFFIRDSNTTTMCVDTAMIKVDVTSQPFITARDTTVMLGQTVDLSTLLNQPVTGSLDFGTTFGTYGLVNPITAQPITYFIRDSIQNAIGCVDTAQIKISIPEVTISLVDRDGDGNPDIADPCNCFDPENILLGSPNSHSTKLKLFHDFVTISNGGIDQIWVLDVVNSGAVLKKDSTIIPTNTPLIDLGGGNYQIDLWHKPNTGFNATFRRLIDGHTETVGNSCDGTVCSTIPTMNEWGLLIFGLLLLNLGLMGVRYKTLFLKET